MSIYHSIQSFASPACHGEDAYCRPCGEFRAICPECEFTVCVFCEDACEGCESSLF